jgi:hypothetical protein
MKHRKIRSFEAMKTFTNSLDSKLSPPPVILSLLKKQYLPTAESKVIKKDSEDSNGNRGIMEVKVAQFSKETSMPVTPENFLSFLSFTTEEVKKIDTETMDQAKCKSWFVNKKGFISAS